MCIADVVMKLLAVHLAVLHVVVSPYQLWQVSASVVFGYLTPIAFGQCFVNVCLHSIAFKCIHLHMCM